MKCQEFAIASLVCHAVPVSLKLLIYDLEQCLFYHTEVCKRMIVSCVSDVSRNVQSIFCRQNWHLLNSSIVSVVACTLSACLIMAYNVICSGCVCVGESHSFPGVPRQGLLVDTV